MSELFPVAPRHTARELPTTYEWAQRSRWYKPDKSRLCRAPGILAGDSRCQVWSSSFRTS